jgi:hypothetical protein
MLGGVGRVPGNGHPYTSSASTALAVELFELVDRIVR